MANLDDELEIPDGKTETMTSDKTVAGTEQKLPDKEKVTVKPELGDTEKVTGEQQSPDVEQKLPDLEKVTGEKDVQVVRRGIGEQELPDVKKLTGKPQLSDVEKVIKGEQQLPGDEKVTGAKKTLGVGEDSVFEELVCPVCLDTYRKPRTLTGCLHTFCEDCLIEYIFQTAKDSDGISFQCPICRITAQGPSSKSKITDWVQNQPVNHVINSLIGKNVKKLVDFQEIKYTCEPCMSQDTEKEARHFCVECGESLCKECVGYHRHLKQTRNHSIVSYDDVGNDPKQAINLTMSSKCNKHPEKEIEFFCKDENELCCISCATIKHRKCPHVLEIAQLDNEFDDTVDALTTMSELKQSIEAVNDLARRNDEAFKHDLEQARIEFQKFKDDVILKMNVIEGKIKKKCTALELGSDSVIADILTRNHGVSSALTASTTQLENIAAHGSSVQKFVALHRTRDQIMEYKRALDTNVQGLRCQQVSLKLRHISSALLECESLADINVEEQSLRAVHSLDKLRRCQTNVYLMKLKWTKMKLLKIQKDLKMRENIDKREGKNNEKAIRKLRR